MTETPNVLDSFISCLIVLFILSVIVEKITQVIRRYAPFIRSGHILHRTPLKNLWRNIRKKQKGNIQSDDRTEREVTTLSFFIGLVITLIFCVDIFQMFNAPNPVTTLYWSVEKWQFYIDSDNWYYRMPLMVIAFILTAFFLTFGSKFFHDLLDTLYQIKILKSKLADKRSFTDPQVIEELDLFIRTPESKLGQLAVLQRAAEIRQIRGVLSVGPGYMNQDGQRISCLEIHINDPSVQHLLQNEYPVMLSSSLEIKVPAQIVITGDFPRVSAGAGGSIANKTKMLGYGTLGGMVKDNITGQQYILSCHHVLNGDLNWKGLSSKRAIVAREAGEPVIADLCFGFRTNEIDAALAKLRPGIFINNDAIGRPQKITAVEIDDALNCTSIKILGGQTNKIVNGFVYNDSWSTKFYYPTRKRDEDELWQLNDLIVLTSNLGQLTTLTTGGDSGAFVVAKDSVLGIVVGGDKFFTYAIKMSRIADVFNIELS